MKKLLLLLTILALIATTMISCGKDDSGNNNVAKDKTSIKVAVLNGTTGFGMAQLMEKNSNNEARNNYTFSVETEGADVIAQLINGSVDIAALPTNAASVVYNRTQGGVKVLAINTLGVLYVVEDGTTVNSISDLEGKTIYCPAQNPQFILQYLLNKNGVNATVDTTYSAPADLRAALASGQLGANAIAVLPEPMVTMAQSANKNLRVALDLTEVWNSDTSADNSQLVQGCVVVRNEFLKKNKDAVNAFLEEYKSSIEYLKSDTENAAKLIVKHGIFANENVAKAAIPKCNVAYMDGSKMKTALSGFLAAMQTVAPASIGGALPTDDFYYVK